MEILPYCDEEIIRKFGKEENFLRLCTHDGRRRDFFFFFCGKKSVSGVRLLRIPHQVRAQIN